MFASARQDDRMLEKPVHALTITLAGATSCRLRYKNDSSNRVMKGYRYFNDLRAILKRIKRVFVLMFSSEYLFLYLLTEFFNCTVNLREKKVTTGILIVNYEMQWLMQDDRYLIISDSNGFYRKMEKSPTGPLVSSPAAICKSFPNGAASSAPSVSRFYLAIFHACQWEIVTLRSYFLTWRLRGFTRLRATPPPPRRRRPRGQ